MPEPVIVLYDGGCRFCRASAVLMDRWDRRRRLGILPFADPQAQAIARRVPERVRFGSVHAARGPVVAAGPDAIRMILGELPGGRVLRGLGVARLYGTVARRRGMIGRRLPDLPPVRREPIR